MHGGKAAAGSVPLLLSTPRSGGAPESAVHRPPYGSTVRADVHWRSCATMDSYNCRRNTDPKVGCCW